MIVIFLSILVKIYYLVNVFQKSFYEYNFIFKIPIKKYSILFFTVPFVLLTSFFESHFLYLPLILIVVLQIFFILKRIKVHLIFTKRVFRLLFTFFLIVFVLAIFIPFWIIDASVPIILIISDVINKPIEYLIKNKYIIKAKRKISNINALGIAVTGSYGKTSTKHYLANVLKNKYLVKYSCKSYNTPLGLSKFINENNFDFVDFLIYEFGARRKGDIYELARIFPYDIAVVTGIGYMHIDTFKTIDTIIEEKMSLCNYIKDSGFVILNYENEYIRNFPVQKKKYTYGIEYGEYRAKNITMSIFGSSFDLYKEENFIRRFNIKPLGRGAILNTLPCIILCDLFEVDYKYIDKILPVENRLSLRIVDNYYILDDAYNSNLLGAKYALEVLKSHDGMRFLITPGFVEMNIIKEDLAKEYAEIINDSCDYVILVKNNFTELLSRYVKVEYVFVETFKKGFELFSEIKEDNSILLIENDLYD